MLVTESKYYIDWRNRMIAAGVLPDPDGYRVPQMDDTADTADADAETDELTADKIDMLNELADEIEAAKESDIEAMAKEQGESTEAPDKTQQSAAKAPKRARTKKAKAEKAPEESDYRIWLDRIDFLALCRIAKDMKATSAISKKMHIDIHRNAVNLVTTDTHAMAVQHYILPFGTEEIAGTVVAPYENNYIDRADYGAHIASITFDVVDAENILKKPVNKGHVHLQVHTVRDGATTRHTAKIFDEEISLYTGPYPDYFSVLPKGTDWHVTAPRTLDARYTAMLDNAAIWRKNQYKSKYAKIYSRYILETDNDNTPSIVLYKDWRGFGALIMPIMDEDNLKLRAFWQKAPLYTAPKREAKKAKTA